MVRLVFRPYTQVYRSICTSEPIRTSTRVSSGFILLRHSSPSFGSLAYCSTSTQSQQPDSKEQSNQQRRYPERGSHPLWFMVLNRKDFGHTTLLEDYTYTPHFEAAKN
uniref:Uncharacterized protein n=1 Tax=Caenorhabditis japonica TaxID=281687 RepID=A0A8R1EN97_CAEJA